MTGLIIRDVPEELHKKLKQQATRHHRSMNKEAIEIFKVNVEEFPGAYNVYDSLGEAYMINGDTKLAIKNYEISLRINPKNDNAKKMIEKMKEK